jgi:hypothetical protein
MNRDPATSQSKEPWIPQGYVEVIGPDDQHYILPEFMVPALHDIFGGHRLKEDLGVFKAAGSVSLQLIYLFGPAIAGLLCRSLYDWHGRGRS